MKRFEVGLLFITIVFILSISIIACRNEPVVDNQNDWTKSIKWQGEYLSFPYNPEEGYAFYNTSDGYSYVYISSQGWTPIAKSGLGITWLGELSNYPSSPSYGQAFFHKSLGNSYVFDGTSWRLLAKSGENGTGIVSWLGELSYAPSNPTTGTAYHNTSDGKSYIYTNNQWNVLAVDGTGIKWVGESKYAPSYPAVNTAYFNTSDNTAYIWNGTSWSTLAVSSSVNYVLSVQWKGNYSYAPNNPSVGWMYYNTTQGKSFIWTGSCWEVVASDGVSPVGYLITWKGSLSTAPANPQQGWCYHNSVDNSSYIFDGSGWRLIVKGDSSVGLHTPSGGKLEVSVDGTVLDCIGSNNFTYEIVYNSEIDSEAKTVTIKNVGSETVYFSDEGPIAFSSNTSYSYYDKSEFDFSDVSSSLDPGCSFSMTIKYNPSKMVYSYIYLYNTSLHNPVCISFAQSNSSAMSTSSKDLQYLTISMSMNSSSKCHSLTNSTSYSINSTTTNLSFKELDFLSVRPNENGNIAELSLSSLSGYAPVYLKGDPFIWIDGDNADDFVLNATITKNVKLVNGGSTSFSIQFYPKSEGEKKATLHILTDIENFKEIKILLRGKCLDNQNLFETIGYVLIDDHTLSTSERFCKMTSDCNDGVYFINTRSDENLLDIYHIDSFGNSTLIDTIDGYYVDYAEYSDGILRIYTYGSICEKKYGNYYTVVALNATTLEYTTQSYTSEEVSILKNPQVNGIVYNQKAEYEDLFLYVNRVYGYDLTMDVYDKEDTALMRITRILNNNEYSYATCISGPFFYFFDKRCLRRISLSELLSEIKK